MPFAFPPSCRRPARLGSLGAATAATAAALTLGAAAAAAAPVVPPGFSVTPFAHGSGPITKPDDIVRLDGRIFVNYQNGVGPQGEPGPGGITYSTIIEYADSGTVLGRWNATGRVDGLGADPLRHLVYATANEDANSTFYVINPYAAPAAQLRHLTYNDPTHAISGGTDAISVDATGHIYLSTSNPAAAGSNAVALATVDSPTVGQVTVTPTFADNASGVQDGNHPGMTTTLALTDPDSNAIVPASSPRFANQFVLDSQADGQLVFSPLPLGTPTDPSTLTQLTLSVAGQPATPNPKLDDVRWSAAAGGALYVVDQGAGIVYRITGPFTPGQAFGSVPTDPSNPPLVGDVVHIDLETGNLTPFATGLASPKGLLYVSPQESAFTLACVPVSVRVGQSTRCTATVTGALHPTGTVSFASNSSGRFSAASCTLQQLGGNQARCSVTYTPAAIDSGSHKVYANYSGDAGNPANHTSTFVAVS